MHNWTKIYSLVHFVESRKGIGDKVALAKQVQEEFSLTRAGSVYYCNDFAIRFSRAKSRNFSNTVLALSVLHTYDHNPFIVCLVTPEENYLMLANSTFLRKISHSSQELRVDNIKGSFNGSDIMRDFAGITNTPENFEHLFASHKNYTFQENLVRLVSETNNIQPTGKKFEPTDEQRITILQSVQRAEEFLKSPDYYILDEDLSARVEPVSSEIAIAAFIENVNLRGRIIEYLITSNNGDGLRDVLVDALHEKKPLPEFFTADELGDYERIFKDYYTETDIKTKILFLSSNPKGYNIDKLLRFLAEDKSVYLIYIVAIDRDKRISTRLCSMYNDQLRNGTRVIKHWAGRNSRGVSQYDGKALEEIVANFDGKIDVQASREFIQALLNID